MHSRCPQCGSISAYWTLSAKGLKVNHSLKDRASRSGSCSYSVSPARSCRQHWLHFCPICYLPRCPHPSGAGRCLAALPLWVRFFFTQPPSALLCRIVSPSARSWQCSLGIPTELAAHAHPLDIDISRDSNHYQVLLVLVRVGIPTGLHG